MREPLLKIGGAAVRRGQRRRLEIPVMRLPTGTALSLPVTVLRGKQSGPTIWLSAALHGDEINGTEIIRRVVSQLDASSLRGTVIAAPIVNVYGFIERSRYLPDRRDLNRSFPGSRTGSLASRLAYLFLAEVVSHCSHGMDFHTGALHRTNLPHLRADFSDPEARRLAKAFAAPFLFQAKRISGSLRAESHRRKIPILVYEAGEPLRFEEEAIQVGVDGAMRVLAALEMVDSDLAPPASPSHEGSSAVWLRAPRSGILHLATRMGETIRKGEILARVADPFSGRRRILRAPFDGLVFSQITNPLVYQGDAILHLARLKGLPASVEAGEVLGKPATKKRSTKKKRAIKKAGKARITTAGSKARPKKAVAAAGANDPANARGGKPKATKKKKVRKKRKTGGGASTSSRKDAPSS